jgi:hypothetical protein
MGAGRATIGQGPALLAVAAGMLLLGFWLARAGGGARPGAKRS